MVMKKMNVINWNRKIYTVPQFSKLYREYAQRVKDGNAEPVAPSSWRRIKQHLVNNKRITAIEIYFDAVILKETNKDHKYAIETTSGLEGFINFIYQVGDMILNATDSTAKCNCADILSTSTTNIVDWDRTGSIIGTTWNPVITAPLSEANEKAITETKKIVAEHDNEIKVLGNRASATECELSDLAGQVLQAAQDNYNQDIRMNDIQRSITDVGYAVNELCDRVDALDRRMMDNLIEINERLNTKVDKSNDEDANCEENKENNFMNKNFMNFKFGKVESDDVRVSMYGIAIKNIDGRYVSWDVKNHSVMDVEIMNMPCGDFLYMMPVAIKDIKSGDVVIHNRVPMFVVEVHASTLKVIDIREGAEKEIYLTKSPFGFNFATKVISLIDMSGNQANADNPFGNFLPFMLMGDDKMDSDMLPMMMLMSGGTNGFTNMASNPMMLYFMMKDGGNMNDMLPLMMMMNQFAAPIEHKCNCECHNEIVEG